MSSIIEITDLSDSNLDLYFRLTENQLRNRKNELEGVFIAESKTVVTLALDAGYQPISLLLQRSQIENRGKELIERCPNIPIYTADDELLSQMTGFSLSRGVIAAMKRPVLPSASEICKNAKRIVILENIADSTNVGAIIRSAAALGIDGILITPSCSDPLLRRSARVSMGTVFQIPWTYIGKADEWPEKSMDLLHSFGFKTVSMALTDKSISIDNPTLKKEERLAIIMGTEGNGLKPDTIRLCDYTVKIPMYHNVDSLNVAAASAVAFWELRSQNFE